MEVRVKLKPLARVLGREELIVIPIAEHGRFVLTLNFYEDVKDGRRGRLVLVEDRFGMLTQVRVIEGDKVNVEAEGVREAMEVLSKVIRIERWNMGKIIPLILNPEFRNEPRSMSRGVRGYVNYVSRYGTPDTEKLRGILTLLVEEVL